MNVPEYPPTKIPRPHRPNLQEFFDYLVTHWFTTFKHDDDPFDCRPVDVARAVGYKRLTAAGNEMFEHLQRAYQTMPAAAAREEIYIVAERFGCSKKLARRLAAKTAHSFG